MTPQSLIKLINSNFSIDIKDNNRHGNYITARDLYFDLSYKYFYPKITFEELAKQINRNHSTMLHAIRKKKKLSYKRILDQYFKLLGNEKPVAESEISDKINRELQKRLDLVEFRYSMLKIKHKELSKDERAVFLSEMNGLPPEIQKNLLERFKIIIEMEKRKIYSYKEKREKLKIGSYD